jgi:hypothetical protein
VWRILNKYAQEAGLEDVSPHVLRHTFATLLLREGKVDPSTALGAGLVTVADLLGHENINTTARYTLSTEADRRAAVEKLAQTEHQISLLFAGCRVQLNKCVRAVSTDTPYPGLLVYATRPRGNQSIAHFQAARLLT